MIHVLEAVLGFARDYGIGAVGLAAAVALLLSSDIRIHYPGGRWRGRR